MEEGLGGTVILISLDDRLWTIAGGGWTRKLSTYVREKKIFFLIYLDISLATQARKIKCKKHKTGFHWEICWRWLCCLHWNTQESPFMSKDLSSTNHLLDKKGNLILWKGEGADLKGSSTCVCATVPLFKWTITFVTTLYYYNTYTTSDAGKRYWLYFHICLFTQQNLHHSRAAPLCFACTACSHFWARKHSASKIFFYCPLNPELEKNPE